MIQKNLNAGDKIKSEWIKSDKLCDAFSASPLVEAQG